MYSIDEIRDNYKHYSDSQIENIAINESKRLRKEVLNILKDEIEERNLNKDLITWINVENDSFSDSEKKLLLGKIERLPCPNCNQRNYKISGFEFNRILSLLIFYSSRIEKRIMCFDCGKRKKKNSILLILISGWWSIKGLFFTPFILISELSRLFSLETKSSEVLNSFIETNTGLIRLHGDKDEVLLGLINYHNNDYEILDLEIYKSELEKREITRSNP